jgi:hypothetical protein
MEVEGSNVDLENFEKSQPWEPSLKVNTPHHRNRNFLQSPSTQRALTTPPALPPPPSG